MNLEQISRLALRQLHCEDAVEKAEKVLKDAKEALRQVQEIDLPNAMDEAGMTSFTLESGEKISVKRDIYASIPKARHEEALAWLDAHGFGDIIKTEVQALFGKGELESAKEMAALAAKSGFPASLSQNVHPQTLKAWLRERLGEGDDVPLDLFGAFEVVKSTIK